mmetsp:Transcript_26150/g.68801  ORF Transcript_26150/g.68801 Transcript_26150/m.68801 type:complete len:215 (+) Transcript_26150:905-1549(+)
MCGLILLQCLTEGIDRQVQAHKDVAEAFTWERPQVLSQQAPLPQHARVPLHLVQAVHNRDYGRRGAEDKRMQRHLAVAQVRHRKHWRIADSGDRGTRMPLRDFARRRWAHLRCDCRLGQLQILLGDNLHLSSASDTNSVPTVFVVKTNDLGSQPVEVCSSFQAEHFDLCPIGEPIWIIDFSKIAKGACGDKLTVGPQWFLFFGRSKQVHGRGRH